MHQTIVAGTEKTEKSPAKSLCYFKIGCIRHPFANAGMHQTPQDKAVTQIFGGATSWQLHTDVANIRTANPTPLFYLCRHCSVRLMKSLPSVVAIQSLTPAKTWVMLFPSPLPAPPPVSSLPPHLWPLSSPEEDKGEPTEVMLPRMSRLLSAFTIYLWLSEQTRHHRCHHPSLKERKKR